MKNLIGRGIVSWEKDERISSRYGSFILIDSNYNRTVKADRVIDEEAVQSLDGLRVRVTVVAKEVRKSGHIGDSFLKIRPTTPEVGEEIDLGVGVFRIGKGWDGQQTFELHPGDGRSDLWIDPRKLYRCHDQTVEVYFEETEDDFTEPTWEKEILQQEEDGALGVEMEVDGVVQTVIQMKRTKVEDIKPKITHIEPGLFVMEPGIRKPKESLLSFSVGGNMEAFAVGRDNSAHTLLTEDQIKYCGWMIASGDSVLYVIEAETWEECVEIFDGRFQEKQTEPCSCFLCMYSSNEKADFSENTTLNPATHFVYGFKGRPIPVCTVHRGDNPIPWEEGLKLFKVWGVLER